MLVHYGYFKKIKVCFKPVGHTHDDPDQMFSVFSKLFALHNIKTLPQMQTIMRSAAPYPECYHLDQMGAFNAYLAPFLPKPHQIRGISKPRVFRFTRRADGVVVYKYRQQLQTEKKRLGNDWADPDLPLPEFEEQLVNRVGNYREQIKLQTAQKQKEVDDYASLVEAEKAAELNGQMPPTNHETFEYDIVQDKWLPIESAGYDVFKYTGVPLLENKVRCSPFKPADIPALRCMIETLQYHLDEDQKTWWSTLVNRFDAEDSMACVKCVELRNTMHDNASRKKDDKEVAKEKGRLRKQAATEMFTHLAEDDFEHPLYNMPSLGPPAYEWRDGDYVDGLPDESVLLAEDDEVFAEHLADLEQEGEANHWVHVAPSNELNGITMDQLSVGQLAIVKSKTSISSSSSAGEQPPAPDYPWFLAEITELNVQAPTTTTDPTDEAEVAPVIVPGYVRIHQYGFDMDGSKPIYENNRHFPRYIGTDPKDNKQKDYYHRKGVVVNWGEPVAQTVPIESLAFAGKKNQVTSYAKNKGYNVKKKVLEHLSGRKDMNYTVEGWNED